MNSRWVHRLMIASVLIGIALRFAWPSDMEYKYDEHYMFDRSQAVGSTEPWPWLGMASGVGLRNPGMSIWIFVALAKTAHISTPVGLAESVMFLNSLALILLAFVVVRAVTEKDQEPWIWATILIAVNPVAVQLERKIWAQSVLPLFCVLFLLSWMKRRDRWGAFFWGLFGAVIAQIHMSGIFFVAAVFLWSLWPDPKQVRARTSVRWREWFFGSVLGGLTFIPWIFYACSGSVSASKAPWAELFNFRYWLNWILEPIGFSMNYSLGHRAFLDFLSGPRLADFSTYGLALAHVTAGVSGGIIVWIGLSSLWKMIRLDRTSWRGRLRGNDSDTARVEMAAFFGYGGLLTALRVFVHRHYLIVTYPLQYVWLGRMALCRVRLGRALLVILWAAQLIISSSFLSYIHTHGGAPEGDYGVAYNAQKP